MKSILSKGANYGWPVVTYGIDYDDTTISTEKKPNLALKTQYIIGCLLLHPVV
jgi:glucose/arabinose dehydrogenase